MHSAGQLRAACPAHPRALYQQDVTGRREDRGLLLEYHLPAGWRRG